MPAFRRRVWFNCLWEASRRDRFGSPRALGFCSRVGGPFAWSAGLGESRVVRENGVLPSSRESFALSNDYPRLAAVLSSFARGSRRLRRLIITKGAERLSNDDARSLACGAYFAGVRRARGRLRRPRNPWSFERAEVSRDVVRTRSVLTASGRSRTNERRRRRLSNYGFAATRSAPSSPTRTNCCRSSSRN